MAEAAQRKNLKNKKIIKMNMPLIKKINPSVNYN